MACFKPNKQKKKTQKFRHLGQDGHISYFGGLWVFIL